MQFGLKEMLGALALSALAAFTSAEEFNSALQDVYYGNDAQGYSCIHVAGKDVFVLLHGDITTPIKPPKIPSFTLRESVTYIPAPMQIPGLDSYKNSSTRLEEQGSSNFSCLNLVKANLGTDYLLADFDGDGLKDLFVRARSGSGDASLLVQAKAAGAGTIVAAYQESNEYNGESYARVQKDFSNRAIELRAEDINGDGKADLVVEGGANADYAYLNGYSSVIYLRTPDIQTPTLVGSSQGSFRVDESGSATYALPIFVPSGVAGVAPQV